MTDADWSTLEDYVRFVADEIGLMDWEIEVSRTPVREDALGWIGVIQGRKVATLKVGWDFRSQKPEDQVNTIVHELLHLHFASCTDVIQTDLAKHPALNDHEWDFIHQTFNRQFEYGIDGVAGALAPTFEPIPWSTP